MVASHSHVINDLLPRCHLRRGRNRGHRRIRAIEGRPRLRPRQFHGLQPGSTWSSDGGCRPSSRSRWRTTNTAPPWLSSFRSSRATVARPVGVRPTTCSPSALQAKCSPHESARGLKIGGASPVWGSTACCRLPRRSLQFRHARARLWGWSPPPWDWGTTWSIVKRTNCHLSSAWQYSQRLPALWRTRTRVEAGTAIGELLVHSAAD